ncbi:MrcB family domain-containing protein [Streptomyces sp. NPDC014894]|uniref:MrcB family domain-containing protein n=1 Tax=Streptomyces sp. NPDC014894 TaxID=3364931 RepID=UPI0036FA0F55
MDIRELIQRVESCYDQSAGTGHDVPGQQLLRSIETQVRLPLPDGYVAKGRGGHGTAAATPWIGLFDPEITDDPKQGLYLAYIFGADLTSVTLTLQLGITRLQDKLGRGETLREHLARKVADIRGQLLEKGLESWAHRPRFGDRGLRPRAYEASSVAARRYEISDLPSESELREDLAYASGLLQQAASVERRWHIEEGESLLSANYEGGGHGLTDPLGTFRPKDSHDYIVNIAAKQQMKTRRHESLIARFGPYIATRGYVPTTDLIHPQDLVLGQHGQQPGDGPQWLVEAKVVRSGNATVAVREAVGQLKEYSYFLYRERGREAPNLLALFTENIGVYSRYLEDHGIASIWQAGDGWQGSSQAVEWEMVTQTDASAADASD